MFTFEEKYSNLPIIIRIQTKHIKTNLSVLETGIQIVITIHQP